MKRPSCHSGFALIRRIWTAGEGYQSLNDGQRTPAQAVRAMLIVALSSPRMVNHLEVDGVPIGGAPDLLTNPADILASCRGSRLTDHP
jgi:hypothetical protein